MRSFWIIDSLKYNNDEGQTFALRSSRQGPSRGNQNASTVLLATLRASIFGEQQLLGWEIIDMESCLYSEMNISIESITMLTSLYMVLSLLIQKIIEKLNTLQDPRENYFSLKMQKLMAEPYVIRCFNKTTEQDGKKHAL